ncbi:hypothetical protein K8I85_13220, partial [bacterium]|nr:hypothetical protein [bacterium]
ATGCSFVGHSAPTGGFASVQGGGLLELHNCLVTDISGGEPFDVPLGPHLLVDCTDVYGVGDQIPGRYLRSILSGGGFAADPALCAPEGFSIADVSACAPQSSPCGTLVGAGPVECPGTGVYVDTQPAALRIFGDGEPHWASALFPWIGGEVHQVSAPDTQSTDFGTLYIFSGWSDGGTQTHDVTVTGFGTIATAQYESRYFLTMETEGGGTVMPESGYRLSEETVHLQAIPDSGWVFERWWGNGDGSYAGPEPEADIVMNEPLLQHAVFVPGAPITIHSVPDGRTVLVGGDPVVTPASFLWPQNQLMSIDANSPQEIAPGERYRFESWSDGGGAAHAVPVWNSPIDLTVEYALEYELTFEEEPHATLTPGDGWYAPGSIVSIEAITDYEWAFGAWVGSGDASYTGLDNPALVRVNGPIHQEAVIVDAFEGHGYDFTISASSTDPFVQQSAPAGGVRNLYLWGTCLQRGLAAMEAQVTGTLPVVDFFPAPNVFNFGSATYLFMAIVGCPTGSESNALLGHWVVGDLGGGTLCLGAPDSTDIAVADCSPLTPIIWPDPGVTGFSSDGSTPCRVGSNPCLEDAVLVELSGLA